MTFWTTVAAIIVGVTIYNSRSILLVGIITMIFCTTVAAITVGAAIYNSLRILLVGSITGINAVTGFRARRK